MLKPLIALIFPVSPASSETITPLTLELTANADQLQDRIKRETPVVYGGIEYVSTKSGTLLDVSLHRNFFARRSPVSLPGEADFINPALDRTLLDLVDDRPWPLRECRVRRQFMKLRWS